ncbi:MAG: bifunctional 3-(3-hydroxy-phenyl)propionate/3-hydroxycinnamic acid hydroxylase, partial [Bacteroidota bacterium]
MKNNYNCDVIIVGLGPTGAVLANILGAYGWSVVALERDAAIYPKPRAVHMDDEIMRIFQSLDLATEISRTSVPFKRMELLTKVSEKPDVTLEVGSQDYPYGYNGAFWFYQPTLEQHIQDGYKRYESVTALFSTALTSFAQNEEVVIARAKHAGDSIKITGKYLIGCDGGKSFVRKTAGLALASANFDEPWVVIDAKTRSGKVDPDLPINHRQYCIPEQPVTYVPMPGPYYRWEFMVNDGKGKDEVVDEDYVREKLKPFVDLDKIDILRTAFYNFHALWAEKWQNGRVLIAGDAAHQMPPFLGQGMCSGLRDAFALGWRLDAILSGKAPHNLLHSYEAERKKHVIHLIKGAVLMGSIIQTKHKWKAWLRNILLFKPLAHSKTFKAFF